MLILTIQILKQGSQKVIESSNIVNRLFKFIEKQWFYWACAIVS